MIVNTDLIYASLPVLARGATISLLIAGLSCFIGCTLGTLFAVLQIQKRFSVVGWLIAGFTALVRGTPMLIQIAMFWVVPQIVGIRIAPLWAAIIAIGLNSSAYMSNIIRAGIVSIGRGQWDAAYTLGFSRVQTFWYIILPQAIRTVLPSLGNEFVTLIKDSSLASTIGVVELAKEGTLIISRTYDALSIYVAVAGVYLLMTIPLTLCINYLEQRMRRYAHH